MGIELSQGPNYCTSCDQYLINPYIEYFKENKNALK